MTDHIGSLKPDPKNARRHTPRNVGLISRSLQQVGFGRSVLLANDGTIIAGNATIEAAAEVGIEDMIVVPSDGTKVIAVQRTDIAPGSREAAQLGVDDNRSAELADGYIPERMRSLDEEFPGLFDGRFDDNELAIALAAVPDFEPVGIEEQGQIDERASVACPECGHRFVP